MVVWLKVHWAGLLSLLLLIGALAGLGVALWWCDPSWGLGAVSAIVLLLVIMPGRRQR